jgi:hypothetical protein
VHGNTESEPNEFSVRSENDLPVME